MNLNIIRFNNQSDIILPVSLLITIYSILLIVVLWANPDYFFYVSFISPLFPILLFILINKLDQAFLLYILFLPVIQHLSPKGISIGDFRITLDILIHFFLMIALLNHVLYTYNPGNKYIISRQDKLLLLFVLFSVFSLIYASHLPINHDKRLLLYYSGVVQPISFYFAILYFLRRIEDFTGKLLYVLLISTFFSGVVAFIEIHAVGFNLVSIFIARMRIGFGYHNTNLFGMHVALLFPVLIYLLKADDHKFNRAIIWSGFFILSLLSVLTLNRGTFIVIAFNLFVLFWKKDTRKIVLGFLIISIIGAIYFSDLLILYINRFVTNSMGGSRFLADESALYRIEVWRVAIETILRYPLGVGGNGFQYMWERISIAPLVYFGTPHQILLYIAVDYGVPALIIFIALIILVIKETSVLSKSKEIPNYKLFFYIKLSIIGYIIHGFLTGGEFSHLWGNVSPNNGFTYILMILLAIVSYHYKIKSSEGTVKL